MPRPILVVVPDLLAEDFGGLTERAVDPADIADVRGVFESLAASFPQFDRRIRNELGAMRRYVNCYVNGDDVRFTAGLASPVGPGDEVLIIQSVAGG